MARLSNGAAGKSGKIQNEAIPKRVRVIAMRRRILEQEEVVQLLGIRVEEAGGQTAWGKKHKIERPGIQQYPASE
jgi:hypothetical protein